MIRVQQGQATIPEEYDGGVLLTREQFAALQRDMTQLERAIKTGLPRLGSVVHDLEMFQQSQWPAARAIIVGPDVPGPQSKS